MAKSSKLMRAGAFVVLLLFVVKYFVLPLASTVILIGMVIAMVLWVYGWYLRMKGK